MFKFYDPKAKSVFKTINAKFFKDVDFVEGYIVRIIVFEEANIIFPLDVIIIIESSPTSDITCDTIQNNIVGEPHRDQLLAPQEVILLRGSVRERRSAFPNDYIAYLHKHKSSTSSEWINTKKDKLEDMVSEDDQVSFHYDMGSVNFK